jgi:hypothetical protein
MNRLYKESFIAKYDGVIPPTIMPKGSIVDGRNVRKVSLGGGWKVRKGCSAFNTTGVDGTNSILSLHKYRNPRSDDYHFISQCGSKLYNSPEDPPATADSSAFTDLGAGASRAVSATTPGFSCTVLESWFYADGSNRPLAFSGLTPYPIGFFAFDASETKDEYIDGTRFVTDKRSDTEALILGAAADYVIVFTNEICEGFVFDLGSGVNSNAVTMTVESWQSGAWSNRSATDGTADTGKTLAVDGTVSWTRSASDEMMYYAGMLAYAYKISWSGALSNTVTVVALTTVQDMDLLSNKNDGIFNNIVGAKFYDASLTEHQEMLGKVGNDSTSMYFDLAAMQTTDFIYIKTPEPACAFFFGIVATYGNQEDSQIAATDFQYWDGDSWEDLTDMTDQTLDDAGDTSFSQSGIVSFDGSAATPYKRRTFEGDHYPGYWYRVSLDAASSAEVRLYTILYAPYPDTLPTYDGCVEFKGRLFVWGDPEYPNRLRHSSKRSPFCFCGYDSGYTDAFGDMKKVLCAIKFYNELIVFKEDSIWLLEGEDTFSFGVLKITDTVGLASPKSAQVVEIGSPTMHNDEPLSIAIWQDTDGIYVLDGRKPRKVSMPIDHYFNVEYTDTAIEAAKIDSCQAFADRLNNEYHFLIPHSATQDDVELVYNYVLDEWYPPWERRAGGEDAYIVTGLTFRGTNNRIYVYGGNDNGKIYLLDDKDETADKDDSEDDVAIEHYIKTRSIGADPDKGPIAKFNLRHIWGEFKTRTEGTVLLNLYVDQSSVPNDTDNLSLIKTGYGVTMPVAPFSITEVNSFQAYFGMEEIDYEMEIYAIIYELEHIGLMEI